MDLKNLKNKFASFGCATLDIDGHNIKEIHNSLILKVSKKPTVIIANTIKGKGVSFMERKIAWHHSVPSGEDLKIAREELKVDKD